MLKRAIQYSVCQFLLLGVVLAVPSLATAGPIGFTGPTNFTGTGRGSAVSATLVSGGQSFTADWAGELNWLWGDTNPWTPDVAPQGYAQSFYAYCLDITRYLGDPQTVTIVGSNGFTNGVLNGGAKAAWLFNRYAEGIRTNVDNVTSTVLNTRAAALQVAIWEAMYDTAGSMTGGNFRLATTGAIRTQAQSYINSLYGDYALYGVSAWTSSLALVLSTQNGQDQMTASVSEPSTLLLMGFGFFVAANAARRRMKATTV